MLRAEPIGALVVAAAHPGLLGVVVVTLATLRFRAFLAPAGRGHRGRAVTGAGPGAGARPGDLAGGCPAARCRQRGESA